VKAPEWSKKTFEILNVDQQEKQREKFNHILLCVLSARIDHRQDQVQSTDFGQQIERREMIYNNTPQSLPS